MESCIYEGQVSHTRTVPLLHRFSYRVFMMYLDLDELPTVFEKRWLWSAKRPAPARFRRENHFGPADRPLEESVRDLVESECGARPQGPIRLLTNLSYFGYCFNPVSYYYCYARDGRTIEAIVAEVTNTPWGERDTYVLPADAGRTTGATRRFTDTKKMHVSPFMPMDMVYDWCFTDPGKRLTVFMANSRQGRRIFGASLSLRRRDITGASLSRVLVRFPFMTLKVTAAIHWEAVKLWWKGAPVYVHPDKRRDVAVQSRRAVGNEQEVR